jgi:glycerol uptake operon antiterminator
MSFNGQKILPAIRKMEDIEKIMESNYNYIVILEVHVSRLKPIFKLAEAHQKKLIVHMDLIHGLKSDEFATEYICQEFKPFGVISTKGSVIVKAAQKGVKSIQRLFAIDSGSIEKGCALIKRIKPDYLEVLPGIIPKVIEDIKNQTKTEVFAGGLIDTIEEVERAYEAGAIAITTSNKGLWKYFEPAKKK